MTLPIDLSAEETDVKKTVLNVIEHGSTYNVEKLAPLYSDNMQVIRVLRDGATSVLTKNDVMQFFASRRSANAEPLSRDAQFNHIEAKDGIGHVVVTRTMKMFGNLDKSVYSICLAKINADWKVVKETVVSIA